MIKLLKKLAGYIGNRWVVSILGLLVIALLIWFFGPDLAFAGRTPLLSEFNRLLLIIVVVFFWGVYSLVAALRQRKTNEKVLDSLAAPPPPAAEDPKATAAREEVETLGGRFREALSILKQARLGGRYGRRYLYQLPWYLMIGPPGSGKTTALVNSGLNFPLADTFGRDSVKGVGGTRNCDWFFTDEAVLIDTAGRYTTQDSDEAVDRSAWEGFLALLKRHRPRRPIDGIIIALSITDLTGGEREERLRHARAVKRRVQEVHTLLQIRAPIYVVFTKCDLIAGFMEFFERLRPEDREQVWGTTFSLDVSKRPGEIVKVLSDEFDALVQRLSERVVSRLEEERDPARRGLLFSFPQQIPLLKGAVQDFLAEAFGPSRFEEPNLLRGVYLSSATQQGTPIDRVIGSVAATFRLERQAMPAFSGRGASFFLTGLLKKVIVPEAGLVTSTNFFERNRPWLLWAAYGGAAAVAGLVILAFAGSYAANRNYVAEVDQTVEEFRRQQAATPGQQVGLVDVLGLLQRIRALANNQSGGSWLMHFGLFQGEKLEEAADVSYRRALKTMLLPRLVARLEQQIVENIDRGDVLYQALKVYLMTISPEHRNVDLVKLWMLSDFESRHPGPANAELRENFTGHLQALFEEDIGSLAENEPLVSRARQTLLKIPLASRVYGEFRDRAIGDDKDVWTLEAEVSAQDLQYFRPAPGGSFDTIPKFFTVAGYQTTFLKERSARIDDAVAETWVLGPDYARTRSEDERQDLDRKVSDLYFAEYIRRWDDLVKDISVVRYHNVEQQANVVRALAQPDSPLKSVLKAIAGQTTLTSAATPEAPADPSLPQRLRDLQGRAEDRIRDLFGNGAKAAPPGAASDPAAKVDQHFAALHKLLRAEGNTPAPIDATLAPLNDLLKALEEVQAYQSQGKDALPALAAAGARLKAAAARLDAQAKFLPEPVKSVVTGVTGSSKGIPERDARQRIAEVWATNYAPACQQALSNRYPFVKTSSADANLVDFARILGPGGEIEQFAKQYVEPFANTSVRPWRWKEEQGEALGLSQRSLAVFEAAARIRQGFFAAGGAQPAVRFDIEPVSLDSRVSQMELELGNQRLVYQHGPRRPESMQWPPPQGSGARLTFTPTGAVGQTITTSKFGPWAFFHLLDEARVERSGAGDRLSVTFDIQGYQAAVQLRADSVINPFSLPELQEFRCRDRL